MCVAIGWARVAVVVVEDTATVLTLYPYNRSIRDGRNHKI